MKIPVQVSTWYYQLQKGPDSCRRNVLVVPGWEQLPGGTRRGSGRRGSRRSWCLEFIISGGCRTLHSILSQIKQQFFLEVVLSLSLISDNCGWIIAGTGLAVG